MSGNHQTAFGGYLQTAEPVPDPILTKVGPGTPGGEYLRRFWHPVALSSELGDLPLLVRALGEDLVLFRDLSGRLGLLHRHCLHRRTSLEFGIPQARGIRCCYHGWVFDVDGKVLETPAEPEGNPYRERLYQGAYPVHEYRGLIFAYLGRPDRRPRFPLLDVFDLPETRYEPYATPYDCNWLQVTENAVDPVHVVFLHVRVSGPQFDPNWGILGALRYADVDGVQYSLNTRRVGDHIWTRINELRLPNQTQAGLVFAMDGTRPTYFARTAFFRWSLPVDDSRTRILGWALYGPTNEPPEWYSPENIERMEQGELYHRSREEEQRRPGDIAAIQSQGPITAHAAEHLGVSDRGVTRFRRRLKAAILGEPAAADRAAAEDAGPLPTHSGDVVLHVAAGAGWDTRDELDLWGRKVLAVVRGADGIEPALRQAEIERRLKKLEADRGAGLPAFPDRTDPGGA